MQTVFAKRTPIQAVVESSTDLQARECHHDPVELVQREPENDNSVPAAKPLSIATEIRNILANLVNF